MEFTIFLVRWAHYLTGVTWIGILYYFNFVQTPFFAEADAAVRSGAIQKLVPRALWWFRWGAMGTFLAGLLMYLDQLGQQGVTEFFTRSYGWAVSVGGLMGTIMFLNVWLVIWPKQKVVIASATQVAQGGQAIPEAAACGRRAALTSRTNLVFSIPMLFYMGAARHYTLFGEAGAGSMVAMTIIGGAIIAAIELNALAGSQGPTKKPLDTVGGALWSGFILTAVFFVLFWIIF